MSPTREDVSPWKHLLRLVWRQALWAIPFALFFGTLFRGDWKSYVVAYKMSLVFAYSIGLSIWVTREFLVPRWLCPPGPLRERVGWRVGAWILLASLIGSYIAAFIIHFTILPGFMGSWRSITVSGMFTLLFAGLFGGINYAIVFYRQAVERARAVEQIRTELAEAELRALRAQINPHFLFNTLNSIASLISTNPTAAEELTTRLADVFRYALRASDHDHASLGDELAFLRTYLEIEQTRFGDRLKIRESIEPGLESARVPSLLLQPLVENAVRYGVATRPEGGSISITARNDQGRLAIEIADDGPGMNGGEPPSGTGFGLHSVRERLRAAGLPDALHINSEPGRGTQVRITLPIQSENSSDSPSKGSDP